MGDIINLVQVMLGSISSLSPSSHVKLKGSGVTGVIQEKHNVMPMAPSVAVFSSLPIVATPARHETPSMQVNRPTANNVYDEVIVLVECAGATFHQ